jgi:hypothetical protein
VKRSRLGLAALVGGIVGSLVFELALRSINGFLAHVGGKYDNDPRWN